MSDVRDSRRAYYRAQAAAAIKRVVKRLTFEGAPAQATLSTALTGSNNDLDFEAQDYGVAGNDVSIQYVAPTAAGQDVSVEVEDNAIVVNLGSNGGTNEVQTVTVVATGGTFILGYKDRFTQPIAYNATTTTVQERLRAVPGLSGVTVGGSAGAWTVTFGGDLAGTNVDTLSIDGNRLMPKAKPRVDVAVVTQGDDDPATNEVQRVTLINAGAGTFTLTFDGQTTSALAYNISAANLLTALRALSNWDDAAGTVTGSGGNFLVTFTGAMAATNQPTITGNAAGLRVASVATTTPGAAYAIDTTAAEVITAIEDNTDAAALVNVTNKSANDGSGVVTAMAATNLSGGKDGTGAIPDAATVVIDPTGTNNSLTYTAVESGLAGNGIRIRYVDPGENDAVLSVDVDEDERLITVSLGTDGSGVITTTGDLLKTEWDATPEAVALATVADTAANDGSGLVTAMSVVETSGGGGEGSSNGIACFEAHGDVMVAVNLLSVETPAGASGTIKVGTSVDDDNLIPSIVATTITQGSAVDKTGLVAALTAPYQTPHQLISDGQKVYLKIGTTDLSDGTLDVVGIYQSVSDGGRLVAVD